MNSSTTSITCAMFAMRRWLLALALLFSVGPLQAQTGAATAPLQSIASLDVPR